MGNICLEVYEEGGEVGWVYGDFGLEEVGWLGE